MIVNLDEMKGYLRVDFDDDDALIENFITTGQNLCADIARLSVDELGAIHHQRLLSCTQLPICMNIEKMQTTISLPFPFAHCLKV